jgi:hypothetical protein
MSSPTIERLRGQNDVLQQISKQLKRFIQEEHHIQTKKQ